MEPAEHGRRHTNKVKINLNMLGTLVSNRIAQ
jgi:hypothetical protein